MNWLEVGLSGLDQKRQSGGGNGSHHSRVGVQKVKWLDTRVINYRWWHMTGFSKGMKLVNVYDWQLIYLSGTINNIQTALSLITILWNLQQKMAAQTHPDPKSGISRTFYRKSAFFGLFLKSSFILLMFAGFRILQDAPHYHAIHSTYLWTF